MSHFIKHTKPGPCILGCCTKRRARQSPGAGDDTFLVSSVHYNTPTPSSYFSLVCYTSLLTLPFPWNATSHQQSNWLTISPLHSAAFYCFWWHLVMQLFYLVTFATKLFAVWHGLPSISWIGKDFLLHLSTIHLRLRVQEPTKRPERTREIRAEIKLISSLSRDSTLGRAKANGVLWPLIYRYCKILIAILEVKCFSSGICSAFSSK